jgi:nitroimidazol reductase NimA-like FMN-containing flavoprotein (pyridoxamine 5'-phosphate oxidase superfamily)
MGALENAERDTFLAGDALARLAVVRPDGWPYVVPVWYQWDGTSLWFVGRERAEWCRFIDNDPRIAVVIDKEHGKPDSASGAMSQIPKIMTQGRAEIVERPNVGGQWVGKWSVLHGVHAEAAALAHQVDARRPKDVERCRMGEALLGGHHRWAQFRRSARH